MDTVERREDDGGRGYVGGTMAAASAMARESEGEVQGANGGVGAVERATEVDQRVQRRGRQAGGAVASSRTPASPLCLLWQEEASGWRGPAQCWAGQWAAR